MEWIIEVIIDSIVRAITAVIAVSVANSVNASIKKSMSKKINANLERFLGADGKVDEEKLNSMITVNVSPMGGGFYNVHVEEEVFGVLDINTTTTRDTSILMNNIVKKIKAQKVRAKFTKDQETFEILEMLEQGFIK